LQSLSDPIGLFHNLVDNYFVLEYDINKGNSTRIMATLTFELPIIAVVWYLSMVFFLPKLMKNCSETKLPTTMQLWNLGLCVMSFCIMLGTGIPWFESLLTRGLFQTVCDPQKDLYKGATGLLFWSYLFALSKYIELLDTLFVIIRNPTRPILFLHWYHHTTVLLFTWFAEYYRFSVGFVFITVNATVHTFMYFYYFLAARGHRPSWAILLTIGQISQMVLGIAACLYWGYNYSHGFSCGCDAPVIIMLSCVAMYGSYLLLFVKFFYERYLAPKKPHPTTTTPNKPKKE